jgi:hypothetical protein
MELSARLADSMEGFAEFVGDGAAPPTAVPPSPDLLEAIRPYLRLLEAKAGTGWCMHDRGVQGLSAAALWARLEQAFAKAQNPRGWDIVDTAPGEDS